MPVFSKLYDILPEHYGWVLFTAIDAHFVNMWMAMRVAKARKEFDVKYPKMYSLENGGDNKFNCIQRAHQNTLEGHPSFLFFLLVSGLQYPKISAGAGIAYLLGRIIYARGYYSGEPEKRQPGGILCHLSELVLCGGVISFAAFQLGWVK